MRTRRCFDFGAGTKVKTTRRVGCERSSWTASVNGWLRRRGEIGCHQAIDNACTPYNCRFWRHVRQPKSKRASVSAIHDNAQSFAARQICVISATTAIVGALVMIIGGILAVHVHPIILIVATLVGFLIGLAWFGFWVTQLVVMFRLGTAMKNS